MDFGLNKKRCPKTAFFNFGAGDEVRTRDLDLGKVALYQLSYSRRRFRTSFVVLNGATKVRGFFEEASTDHVNFHSCRLSASFSG